jgi:hypothetical protein
MTWENIDTPVNFVIYITHYLWPRPQALPGPLSPMGVSTPLRQVISAMQPSLGPIR